MKSENIRLSEDSIYNSLLIRVDVNYKKKKVGDNLFYVTSLDGSQVEPIINIGTDFKMEQTVDGTFTVSFSCFPSEKNNAGYDLLQSESIVTIDNYDFKIKQFNKNTNSKSVTGISTFFEHSKTQKDAIFSGSHTLSNHLDFVLSGIGWVYTVDSDVQNVINYINNLGEDNVVSLVNKICKYHQIEYIILPNNHLHFAKQIGSDNDYQYRYKHNVSEVVLKEDTSNLYTFIRGYGKEGLEVSYTSPYLSTFGKLEATPIKDERFTDATALTDYIKAQIQDVPELAIESKIPELTSRETGEKVWLIYEPLNVEMQTRILKQTKILVNGELITQSIVFGNTLIKSSTDLLVEQQIKLDETKEELEETIDETVREINLKFNETDTKIVDQYQTITNEYSASITANAQVIRTEMNQKETTINNSIGAQYTKITSEYNSAITQTAQSIRSDVTASITAVNGSIQNVQNYASRIEQTANQIQSNVSSQQTTINSHGSRISSAESSITQQSNLISQKVSQTDYTGRTITSLINQDPYAVSISASKINLNGAVIVNGDITGATNISVTSDIRIGNAIRFSDFTEITTYSGDMTINTYNDLTIQASNTRFWGNVDFSGAYSVTGLSASSINGYSMSYSTSGGKKYMTFRQNGSYLGMVEIS